MQVPLAPLADGNAIDGDFQLISNEGTVAGTVSVKIAWAHPYAPGSAETAHNHDAPTPVLPPNADDDDLPFVVGEDDVDKDVDEDVDEDVDDDDVSSREEEVSLPVSLSLCLCLSCFV